MEGKNEKNNKSLDPKLLGIDIDYSNKQKTVMVGF